MAMQRGAGVQEHLDVWYSNGSDAPEFGAPSIQRGRAIKIYRGEIEVGGTKRLRALGQTALSRRADRQAEVRALRFQENDICLQKMKSTRNYQLDMPDQRI